MNSAKRIETVGAITQLVDSFGVKNGMDMHYSGLPPIRTRIATKVATETTWFLLGSVCILSLSCAFFRERGRHTFRWPS